MNIIKLERIENKLTEYHSEFIALAAIIRSELPYILADDEILK